MVSRRQPSGFGTSASVGVTAASVDDAGKTGSATSDGQRGGDAESGESAGIGASFLRTERFAVDSLGSGLFER